MKTKGRENIRLSCDLTGIGGRWIVTNQLIFGPFEPVKSTVDDNAQKEDHHKGRHTLFAQGDGAQPRLARMQPDELVRGNAMFSNHRAQR